MTPRRRIGLVLLTAGVAIGIALGLLSTRALELADREERLQQQFVADRLFDRMEQELNDVIAAEEARPFDHWRPTILVGGEPEPSPLASGPSDPIIAGYFQIDPDGSASSPHGLAGTLEQSLPELPARFAGWGGEPPGPSSVEVVVPGSPAPAPRPRPAPRPQPSPAVVKEVEPQAIAETQQIAEDFGVQELALLDIGATMNTAVQERVQRGSAVQNVDAKQLGNFVQQQQIAMTPEPPPPVETRPPEPRAEPVEPPRDPPEPEVVAVAEPPPEPARPTPARRVTVDVPTTTVVDIQVSPLRGTQDASGRWLVREVRFGEQTWVQGMLLDEPALKARIGRVTADLQGVAELSWTAPTAGDFVHEFAEPFTGLSASLRVAPLEATASVWTWISSLTLLTALFALLGLGAAWRTSTTSLALARERSDFVSAVTHELRSPLTSIRMYAEMLQSGMVQADKQSEYHGVIREEAERLSRLVEDVLTFARLERGIVAVTGSTATVQESLAQIEAVFSPVLAKADQTLTIELAPDVREQRLPGDALAQVLTNLIDNAAKFSPEGTALAIQGSLQGQTILLRVRDHGPGVDESVRRQMFKPFFRAERELTRQTRGTGIGLALVAGIVQELGGQISAHHHADGGLQVEVRLPVERPS